MDLDDLIAAERAEPRQATPKQAGQVWRALERSMITVAPPALPVPSTGAEASVLSKLGAALSTAAGKTVVATTLIVGGATGATQLVGESEAPPAQSVVSASDPTAAEHSAAPTPPPQTEAPDPEALAPAPPEPEEPEEPIEFFEPEPEPDLTPPPPTAVRSAPPAPRTKAPSRPKPAPASSLSDELRLIQRAQQALSRDQPQRALRALAEHRTSFPDGSMREDREALRVVALCKRGDADGDAAARSFRRQWPRSLFSQRIETACK